MKLKVDETADGLLLEVDGEIDMESSPRLRDELKKAVKKKPGFIRLKLTQVPYIDSSGVAVLIEGMKWSKKKDISYALVDISTNVRDVLKLSHLLDAFTIEGMPA